MGGRASVWVNSMHCQTGKRSRSREPRPQGSHTQAKANIQEQAELCPLQALTSRRCTLCGKQRQATTSSQNRKRSICVFKCWLICQLASFEALQSLENKPSTTQSHRGARSLFLRLVVPTRYPSNWGNFHVFLYHIG